jgi:hypothetical protein
MSWNEHPSGLTFASRLLVLLTLMIAIGGSAAYIWWIHDGLEPGSYPLMLFAVPAVVLAAVILAAGAGIMKLLGIPFFTQRDRD